MQRGIYRLKCVSLYINDTFHPWDPQDLTVGKIYTVTVLEQNESWELTQCEITDNNGERRRILGGHFDILSTENQEQNYPDPI